MSRSSKRPRLQNRGGGDDFMHRLDGRKQAVDTMTGEDIKARLREFQDRWGIQEDHATGTRRVEAVCDAVKCQLTSNGWPVAGGNDAGNLQTNSDDIRGMREMDIAELAMLSERCRTLDLDDQDRIRHAIKRMQECVHYVWLACTSLNRAGMCAHPQYEFFFNDDELNLRFESEHLLGGEDMSPLQKVVIYFTENMRVRGYKRLGDQCYKMILTKNNLPTRVWRPVTSIRQMLLRLTSQDSSMAQMKNVLSRGDIIPNAVTYLTEMTNWRFPDLVKDRRLVAFKDGLYVTDFGTDTPGDRFVPYDALQDVDLGLQHDTAASRMFDVDFPAVARRSDVWSAIPTPSLDKILSAQRLDPEVCKWMYIMLGRLLHEVGRHDGWQCVLYIKGAAGTGKSTIVNEVASKFFDVADVGRLDNNVEKQWCLSNLYDKMLFAASEIKRNFRLSQCEFQKMISGEEGRSC